MKIYQLKVRQRFWLQIEASAHAPRRHSLYLLFGKILEDPADSNDTRREATRALAEISEDHFDGSETTIISRDNQLVSIREFDSSTHTILLAFSPH